MGKQRRRAVTQLGQSLMFGKWERQDLHPGTLAAELVLLSHSFMLTGILPLPPATYAKVKTTLQTFLLTQMSRHESQNTPKGLKRSLTSPSIVFGPMKFLSLPLNLHWRNHKYLCDSKKMK